MKGPITISADALTKIEPGSTYAVCVACDDLDRDDALSAKEAFREATGAELVLIVIPAT